MPAVSSPANNLPRKRKLLLVQAGVLILVFSASLLAKIPTLRPSFREILSPIGSQELFSSIILYSAPFFFLLYCLASNREHLKISRFDLIYGSITLLHLVSYFWVNRGFHPVNPILINICIFFLYLLSRNIQAFQMKNSALFMLAIPIIPIAAEACQGLLQANNGHLPVKGPFLNYNFMGMLLAMGMPLAVSQVFAGRKGPLYRITALGFSLFLFTIIILTTSRTAACGTVLALGGAFTILYRADLLTAWKSCHPLTKIAAASAAIISSGSALYYVYSLRPLSVWGRLHLAKIGVYIFSDNFLAGIGFGEIPNTMARYQRDYFLMGNGTELDRLLAGTPGAVTSEFLEAAVETGAIGLLLYIPFWILILAMAFSLIRPTETSGMLKPARNGFLPSLWNLGLIIWKGEQHDMVRFGAGTTLLLYMIMSISYSPSRIIQISMIFSYVLGISVSLHEAADDHH